MQGSKHEKCTYQSLPEQKHLSVLKYLWTPTCLFHGPPFLFFPLEACFDSPGGTRHRWAPRRQPMPREERWDGQMVQDEMSRGGENIDARAKISSASELISLTPTLRVWPKISFWHEDSGTTTAPSYRLSEAQTPPSSFWKQQLTSIHSRKTNSTNSEHEMFRTQLVQLAIIRLHVQLCRYCLYL